MMTFVWIVLGAAAAWATAAVGCSVGLAVAMEIANKKEPDEVWY